ncbi:FAD-binding oxidoreductase [Actinokineospora sp. G85]|uniref:FAD-binding oxidoreductase n=1 Tax=Actinokineospora sp. G85 TaxID=3406626 RepID=UPI003C72AEAD
MTETSTGPRASRPSTPDLLTDLPADVIGPDDIRYDPMTSGENLRFVALPDQFRLCRTAEHVREALQSAVAEGKRVTVQSGGHCGEAFVSEPRPDVVLDLSRMAAVGFDTARQAFLIEPGATIGRVYRELFVNWGVTIPGGTCVGVGAGGHICGGGLGPLSRLFGLTVDHLEAVEVVVVRADGRAEVVVATGADDDPHQDLFWAHTGGGGGNFGVVTKYWMRTPGATGGPSDLLPRPPRRLHLARMRWPWAEMTEAAFTRLVGNFSAWQVANSGVDTPYAGVYSYLECLHRDAADVTLTTQVVADDPGSTRVLEDFLATVNEGVGITPTSVRHTLPWLDATWYVTPADTGPAAIAVRRKVKSADLRGTHTPEQVAAVWRHLTTPDFDGLGYIEYMGYGGRVNAVAPTATARVQRSTTLKTFYNIMWTDPANDDKNIRWLQEFYREVHAETGGVPVPGEVNTGAYLNYPDIDLADPAWNTSGVPWHELYYGENYPRLQRVKARYDPLNVFNHALSVRLPE